MSRREGDMVTVYETPEEKKKRKFAEEYLENRDLPAYVRYD